MCASVQRLRGEGLSIIGHVSSFSPERLQPILEHNLKEQLENRRERYHPITSQLNSIFLEAHRKPESNCVEE